MDGLNIVFQNSPFSKP